MLFRGVRAPASLKLTRELNALADRIAGSSGAYAPRPH